jgi:hypothetical protein
MLTLSLEAILAIGIYYVAKAVLILYQQSKAHDPELEPLFTQAETAW